MINVLRANEVQFEDVRWLWWPYVPFGMVSGVVGDPGSGKTWLACKIATCVSQGIALPHQRTALPPQKVLFASADDSVTHTLGPRMRDLGAELSRVFFVEDRVELTPKGLREFGEVVSDYAVTFVVIDPIVGFFGGDKNMNDGVDVRQVMGGLKVIAEESGAAIVTIRHKRKASAENKSGPRIYDGSGNIDFVGAVRSEFHVRNSGEPGVAVMDHVKTNIGPTGASIGYRFGSHEDGSGKTHHQFEWLEAAPALFEKGGAVMEKARDLLRDLLSAGPIPAKMVYDRASEAGIGERTLKEAKKGIAVSEKTSKDGGWQWRLI